jgi:hypothetical protein
MAEAQEQARMKGEAPKGQGLRAKQRKRDKRLSHGFCVSFQEMKLTMPMPNLKTSKPHLKAAHKEMSEQVLRSPM